MRRALAGIAIAVALLGGLAAGTVGTTNDERPGTLRWEHQYGTSSNDSANALTTDINGHVYVAGTTDGALDGGNAGANDAYVRTYDSDGDLRWAHQYGTGSNDSANAVATDADGTIYVAGSTSGPLDGDNAGANDAYIRAYDSDGTLHWARQYGTSQSDSANAIATDGNGTIYVAGETRGALEGENAGVKDAYIRAYDSDGDLRWTRQFGTSGTDSADAIATDADGNIYAAGSTSGALEGSNAGINDAYIRAYDSDGNLRWTRQYGTSHHDTAPAIATDTDGNIYTAGETNGALEGSNAGANDLYVRAYDSDGDLRWTRQFGTLGYEAAYAITTDADDNVYAAGFINDYVGGSNARRGAYIRAYDSNGNLRWSRQYGASKGPILNDRASAIATDVDGNIYEAGETHGALAGSHAGGSDAFVRSYTP